MSTSGDIRWLHKYRVLVCRSRYCSPWDWWVSLFPQTYSAARGEMVASSTTCPSWRPLWKFEEAVESQTWECKSNIKSCNGHKQQCFSWNGSSWVIFGSSSKGMKPQAFCFMRMLFFCTFTKLWIIITQRWDMVFELFFFLFLFICRMGEPVWGTLFIGILHQINSPQSACLIALTCPLSMLL